MDDSRVLSAPSEVRALFDRLDSRQWPLLDDHPLFGRFVRRLYPTVRPESRVDLSFVIARGDDPILVVPCTAADGVLSCYGLPATFVLRAGLDSGERSRAVAHAFRHVAAHAPAAGVDAMLIRGGSGAAPSPEVDAECERRDAAPERVVHAVVDLDRSAEDIWRDVRRRFRSYINWGRRNVRLEYVDRAQWNPEKCTTYARFHAEVAGRIVHSPAYWAVVWDEIRSGRGELSLGYLADGRLVAGSIVTFAGGTAYYASGVYDRSLFDKPISHWPMFDAILRAKAQGLGRFDIGEVPPRDGGCSEKETNIGYFKRGFSSLSETMTRWRWRLAE